MWFEELTGFKEESPENVRAKLKIEGDTFVSMANHKRFSFGKLDVVTLEELRQHDETRAAFEGKIQLSEVVADVKALHTERSNANALFQAASQFNLLEMIGPSVTPEQGIDRYERDLTQGPACAIACGAGTIYRNYFVKIGDQIGQSEAVQIDCLDLIGKELQNDKLNLWSMKNGYALADLKGLLAIDDQLSSLTDEERERLKGKLKVGIQWNTEVTISHQPPQNPQKVSQIYCSALPVGYSQVAPKYWESFARLILESTYEATLYAALMNMKNNDSNVVYLTFVGGGAFGNEEHWIFESIEKVIHKFKNVPLDVRFVSYKWSNRSLQRWMKEM